VVGEQVLGQKDGYRLTLLTFENESVDPDDDEAVEHAWEAPAFKRR
jgi:hypothetical protein